MNEAAKIALDTWRINFRATAMLVEAVPDAAWAEPVPGIPRRTIRSIAAHLHNCRCQWMKGLAIGTDIVIPERIDAKTASKAETLAALGESADAILRMINAGIENGGRFPGVSGNFYFGAMPVDARLFAAYALAHEAHHRGQIMLIAKQVGEPLPKSAVNGVWQWSSRLRESE